MRIVRGSWGLAAILVATVGGGGCAARARAFGDVAVYSGHPGANAAAGVKRSAEAVAVVETDVGRGMAFAIDPEGYLITNRHVVEDADHVDSVTFLALDPPRRFESVQVVYTDPVHDLALLRVHPVQPLPYIPLATGKSVPTARYLQPADPVVLLEREGEDEKDAELSMSYGKVRELSAYNPVAGPGPFVGVTSPVERGQSGGPVLDRWGRAVGIVTWTWRDRRGGYAIPIAEATRMLAARPRLASADERSSRAESRTREFLAALGRGDVDDARRLTSPSHARSVREQAVDAILEAAQEQDGAPLRGFIAAIEKVAKEHDDGDAAIARLRDIVGRTSSKQFRDELGLDKNVREGQVVSFFYELGQAYLAARRFGGDTPEQALDKALRRLNTVEAARTFAVADAIHQLSGRSLEIADVDVVPGVYAPTAVVTLRSSAKKGEGASTIALHMRMEWGDWYVAEIGRAALSDPPVIAREG